MKQKQTKQCVNGRFQAPSQQFTQVSNDVLRDAQLSLGAKGLFSLIASYITLPGFTLYKKYIQSQCQEGRHAFDRAWKELQQAGYLTHQRVRGEDGTFGYLYQLELPQKEKPTETKGTTPSAATTKAIEKKGKSKDTAKSRKTFYLDTTCPVEKGLTEVPSTASLPVAENQTPVLLYRYNKTLSKNTQSVSTDRQDLEEQVEWDYFLEESAFSGGEREALSLLLDYLVQERMLAAQENSSLTLEQINQVDSCTFLSFLEHMKGRRPQKVYYPSAYLTTAFKNYLDEEPLRMLWM